MLDAATRTRNTPALLSKKQMVSTIVANRRIPQEIKPSILIKSRVSLDRRHGQAAVVAMAALRNTIMGKRTAITVSKTSVNDVPPRP